MEIKLAGKGLNILKGSAKSTEDFCSGLFFMEVTEDEILRDIVIDINIL